MTAKPRVCQQIESDLIATASGDAGATAAERVQRHVAACPPCRRDFDAIARSKASSHAASHARARGEIARSRAELAERLADLRSRLVRYGIFDSPLAAS